MIDNISVVIIAKNPEKNLKRLFDTLKPFKEIILYLNNTTDDSKKIAKQFQNVKVIEGEFIGFGPTKNRASTYAKNEWILSLDDDEIPSISLLEEIKKLKPDNSTIYKIKRYNYYKNKKINHCGWGEEKIVRLYNKNITNFNNNLVHEKIIIDNLNIKILNGELKHYSYNSISDFLKKMDTYSEIFSNDYKGKRSSSPFKAIYRSIFHFIRCYIFKKGVLDGYEGFLICSSGANSVFYKYLKLYEKNLEK